MEQWRSMRSIVAGAIPKWVPHKPKQGRAQAMAGEVAGKAHAMQAGLWLGAKAHTARGQRSAQWMREREANSVTGRGCSNHRGADQGIDRSE